MTRLARVLEGPIVGDLGDFQMSEAKDRFLFSADAAFCAQQELSSLVQKGFQEINVEQTLAVSHPDVMSLLGLVQAHGLLLCYGLEMALKSKISEFEKPDRSHQATDLWKKAIDLGCLDEKLIKEELKATFPESEFEKVLQSGNRSVAWRYEIAEHARSPNYEYTKEIAYLTALIIGRKVSYEKSR